MNCMVAKQSSEDVFKEKGERGKTRARTSSLDQELLGEWLAHRNEASAFEQQIISSWILLFSISRAKGSTDEFRIH